MNVKEAAALTLDEIEGQVVAERRPSGKGVEHARWMLNGILSGYVEQEKAHRWLGYAQGIIVGSNAATLDEMKAANKRA